MAWHESCTPFKIMRLRFLSILMALLLPIFPFAPKAHASDEAEDAAERAEFVQSLMKGSNYPRPGLFRGEAPDRGSLDRLLGQWLYFYESQLDGLKPSAEERKRFRSEFMNFLEAEMNRTESLRKYDGELHDANGESLYGDTPPPGSHNFFAEDLMNRLTFLSKAFAEIFSELHPEGEPTQLPKGQPVVARDRPVVTAEALRVLIEMDLLIAKTSGSASGQLTLGSLVGGVVCLASIASACLQRLDVPFGGLLVGGFIFFHNLRLRDNMPWKRGLVPQWLRRRDQRSSIRYAQREFLNTLHTHLSGPLQGYRENFWFSLINSHAREDEGSPSQRVARWLSKISGISTHDSIRTILDCRAAVIALHQHAEIGDSLPNSAERGVR